MGRLKFAILLCFAAWGLSQKESFADFFNSLRLSDPLSSPSPSPSASSSPSPQPTESPAKAPIKCFVHAIDLGLTVHQSILLCTNAKSLDPIRCFKRICDELTRDQAVSLCQGATSKAPAVCFDETFEFHLFDDQRIKLCNTASFIDSNRHDEFETAPAQCFKQTVPLPLSQDEKVILCADAPSDHPDAPVKCFSGASLGLSMDQRVRLCTQLTPSSW